MATETGIQTIERDPYGLDTDADRADVVVEYRREPGHDPLALHLLQSQVCQPWLVRAAGWEIDRSRYYYRRIGYPSAADEAEPDVVVDSGEYWRQYRRHRRTGEPSEFDGVVSYGGGEPEQSTLI